ncbi:MAG: small basic protein [Candidatus Omnitrophica bacterium]|nr:small basic protein [Candidatus Omnitrophota bacterium]
MSQHPSLTISGKGKRHRSVFKRFERIKILKKEGKWKEKNSIFGLPKVKSIKIRVKKEKVQEEKTAQAQPSAQTVTTQPEIQKKEEKPKK